MTYLHACSSLDIRLNQMAKEISDICAWEEFARRLDEGLALIIRWTKFSPISPSYRLRQAGT